MVSIWLKLALRHGAEGLGKRGVLASRVILKNPDQVGRGLVIGLVIGYQAGDLTLIPALLGFVNIKSTAATVSTTP